MGFDPERQKFTALEYFDFRHTCTSLKLPKPQLHRSTLVAARYHSSISVNL